MADNSSPDAGAVEKERPEPSPELRRINALRNCGYFVRVIRQRPIELELVTADNVDEELRTEEFGPSDGLYVRSELDALKRRPQIQAARFHGKGGVTIVRLELDDGMTAAEGVASCRRDEAFCRRTGLRIALGRAEKDLGLAADQAEAVSEASGAAGDDIPF